MQRSTAPSASAALARTRGALGRRANWLQLIRFCLVGASGYVVNLVVYTVLLKAGDVHYLLAATGSFLVAVTSNYTWNRLWTFRGQRGHVAYQGLRFLVVSTIALGANLLILALLVASLDVGKVLAQAIAIVLVTPVELRGEQALVLRALPALAAALAALALAGPAAAASAPTEPVFDEDGRLVETPFVPAAGAALLSEQQATRILFREPKVADWLDRYPPKPQTDAEYRPATDEWVVKAWSGDAGQIVLGKVDDRTGEVREAWTGPQVAWTMARGGAGAFGGKTINGAWLWVTFCALFLIGLADLRRPLSLRNLDLLALLSFSVSLRLFNEGEIFWSVPLAYPPLAYLLGRCVWIARRDRPPRTSAPVWPVWLLAAACVFLTGFRVGLNVEAQRSVIDVGFAGVVGAHRIANGEMPYGHMPVQENLKACGTADAEGEIRERIQTNGRCEASNARGDTYGPISYLAYLPGYAVFGWTGKWDELWAAHATALLFDALCILGLALVGRRYGGPRLAATLAFAWAAYPFTLYASNSNTNDAIMPALLIWGFWLASSAWARGAGVALAGWTKFAALLLAPLWLSYPNGLRIPARRFALGFAGATVAAFLVLLLEPDPLHAARVFAERTFGFQLDRESPFSIWGWGQYHARGVPDLHAVQQVLQVLLIVGAGLVAFRPRRKSILQLAALTAAVLIGFELVLTHWFYLYIPWFFPFVAFAVLYRRDRAAQIH